VGSSYSKKELECCLGFAITDQEVVLKTYCVSGFAATKRNIIWLIDSFFHMFCLLLPTAFKH
jgi:hypothetical protein